LTDKPTNEELIHLADEILAIESHAVNALRSRLDKNFIEACNLCLTTLGRVVVCGIGKSGHVGGKIAATLSSTGTPSFFMHPAEASHGDLGMITNQDLLLAISYSGETEEIITILPIVKRVCKKLISITGNKDSTLAKAADVHLDVSVTEEACPLNLSPTASSTASMAMGDALALTLLNQRGFTEEDFARSHPSGNLGKRLLLRVMDIMHTGDKIPMVSSDVNLRDGLMEMTKKGLGMTAVVSKENTLEGIFTDGDLRRNLDKGADIFKTKICDVMHKNCKTISANVLATEALSLLEKNKITSLLVVNEKNKLIGALNIHDLFREGLI
tara:strand:+ start:12534 stop:13517 length:984 start_codon:yes stop_codon:yes gene_type:complete